MALIH